MQSQRSRSHTGWAGSSDPCHRSLLPHSSDTRRPPTLTRLPRSAKRVAELFSLIGELRVLPPQTFDIPVPVADMTLGDGPGWEVLGAILHTLEVTSKAVDTLRHSRPAAACLILTDTPGRRCRCLSDEVPNDAPEGPCVSSVHCRHAHPSTPYPLHSARTIGSHPAGTAPAYCEGTLHCSPTLRVGHRHRPLGLPCFVQHVTGR